MRVRAFPSLADGLAHTRASTGERLEPFHRPALGNAQADKTHPRGVASLFGDPEQLARASFGYRAPNGLHRWFTWFSMRTDRSRDK